MAAPKRLQRKPEHKGDRYREGELELILNLAPTHDNVRRLAKSLGRSIKAIEIVYRIAYQPGRPFGRDAEIQRSKIEQAKSSLRFISALAQ